MKNNTAVRLLVAAAVLMLLSACIFCFLRYWLYAVLVTAGAFGCLAAALSFKNREK